MVKERFQLLHMPPTDGFMREVRRSTDAREGATSEREIERIPYATEFFTGARASGLLTMANLVAMKPTIELQRQGPSAIFVADMHGATTLPIAEAQEHNLDLVRNYLAMGLNPEVAIIFIQSHLAPEIALTKLALERWITVAELVRQPALKDKVKADPTTANVSLATYPIMMAADILLQDAHYIPVGADQLAHIELTRDIVDAVNSKHGAILAKPEAYKAEEPPRYLSLRGEGKMSKSNPNEAILLSDPLDVIARKIKSAETAFPGETSAHLESLLALARRLAPNDETKGKLETLYQTHMEGGKAMGDFKQLFTLLVVDFIRNLQEQKASISDATVETILREGADKARENAHAVMKRMRAAKIMF